MAQVKVITDSTSDLSPEIAERYGVAVVPLNVHFGEETYKDGVEITADEFLRRLASSPQPPKTSQPSPEEFRRAYERAAQDASGIVCVTVSNKLSGTFNAAAIAARQFEGAPVRVVDSLSATTALGLIAIATAEAANGGASLEEVERVARDVADRTNVVFYADTLEYLQRGGRIGRAQGMLGSILDIKPVLTLVEGEAAQYQRTRTRGKAIQAIVDWAAKLPSPERVSALWSHNEDDLNRLLDGLAKFFPRDEILVAKYGPAIASHVGPGAMGVSATWSASGGGA